jgi:hemolysin III
LIIAEKNKKQSLGEEIANSITHGVGAIAAVVGMIILLINAKSLIEILSSVIFGGALIVLYTMSTLYHAISNQKAKRILQVFDHCSIFLLIVGTYAPFCLLKLNFKFGMILFSFNLLLGLIGIILNIINIKRWHKLSLVFYILMGWSITFGGKNLINAFSSNALALLFVGGLCYTLGVIFYLLKRYKYMHMIWHFFVLAGSITHYFCVLFYII